MRRPSWKLLGLASVAGVAATGAVVVARRRRDHEEYDPAELRGRLHRRLEEVDPVSPAAPTASPPPSS